MFPATISEFLQVKVGRLGKRRAGSRWMILSAGFSGIAAISWEDDCQTLTITRLPVGGHLARVISVG